LPADPPTDAAALVAILAARGLRVTVHVDGALVVLQPSDARWFPDATLRAELVRVAREVGFTNVAVELPRDPSDAAGAG
jgi:prophage tail gpP-like protein